MLNSASILLVEVEALCDSQANLQVQLSGAMRAKLSFKFSGLRARQFPVRLASLARRLAGLLAVGAGCDESRAGRRAAGRRQFANAPAPQPPL